MRFRLYLAIPLVSGLTFGCEGSPAVVLTLSGRTASGGCHFPVPGRSTSCLEYFYVDAAFAERGGADAVIEDARIETCTMSECTESGKPYDPRSDNNRYAVPAHGTLTLRFAPLYATDRRPDRVRVTATVVAGDTRRLVQGEAAVPVEQAVQQ